MSFLTIVVLGMFAAGSSPAMQDNSTVTISLNPDTLAAGSGLTIEVSAEAVIQLVPVAPTAGMVAQVRREVARLPRVSIAEDMDKCQSQLRVTVIEVPVDAKAHYAFNTVSYKIDTVVPAILPALCDCNELLDEALQLYGRCVIQGGVSYTYSSSADSFEKGLREHLAAYADHLRKNEQDQLDDAIETILAKNPAKDSSTEVSSASEAAARNGLDHDALRKRAMQGDRRALRIYVGLMDELNRGQMQFGREAFDVLQHVGDSAFAEACGEIRFDCQMMLAMAFDLVVGPEQAGTGDQDTSKPWRERFPNTSRALDVP